MGGGTVRLTSRKRIFVDPKVQGALLIRSVIYWFLGATALSLIVFCWNVISGPPGPVLNPDRFAQLWEQYGIVALASLLLLPIVLIDVVVLSNRFTGPLHRMRCSLRALAAGEFVQPVHFRDRDFWHDVAEELNAVAAYVERLKQQNAAAGQRPRPDRGQELEPLAQR
jgi:hypothetical protein